MATKRFASHHASAQLSPPPPRPPPPPPPLCPASVYFLTVDACYRSRRAPHNSRDGVERVEYLLDERQADARGALRVPKRRGRDDRIWNGRSWLHSRFHRMHGVDRSRSCHARASGEPNRVAGRDESEEVDERRETREKRTYT